MEQWSDRAIKKHIEVLIEESYILSLPETEMREYFRDFIEACDHVLNTNISLHDNLKIVKIKMALLKARLLIDQGAVLVTKPGDSGEKSGAHLETVAHQIVNTKRALINFFELLDPRSGEIILHEAEEKKQVRMKARARRVRYSRFAASTGYYLLLVGAIALSLYVVIH
ncbi:hypothetical protein ACFL47_07945 [Candidatus Latescibacterota bacterium]